ncbi:universal stress protein [Pseudarthrobacter enclensis]|uniref:Nucleotide-binding universal stress UspA family protein n=1 Tax=Pseudarthrobacter enclensis TaxID=993070 RepID=A0ABT9RWG2_9MICC|nr:universal stress protein [Pseudarthrobacter enclensis]MDP9889576.1 nucleotide-binding universal stress UspA family protein [Pseudarthrobacter enclensis]
MTTTASFLIVVGFDGSEPSREALAWAIDEGSQRRGKLLLITAWNKPALAWYPAVLETAAGEIAAEDSPEKAAETLQAEALKKAADKGVDATGQVVHNNSPSSAILDAARNADLVVVGSRGHGGFPGLHLGSVTTQVIDHAPCPVLVVRPKAT